MEKLLKCSVSTLPQLLPYSPAFLFPAPKTNPTASIHLFFCLHKYLLSKSYLPAALRDSDGVKRARITVNPDDIEKRLLGTVHWAELIF